MSDTLICIDPECAGCTTYGGYRWTGAMWLDGDGYPQRHVISVIKPEYRKLPSKIIPDDIKKPTHYIFSKPANDVLDVLAECGFNMPDHYIASAIAYLCRCKKKNQYRKDLEKAAFYINKAIELHDAEERSNSKNK